VNTRIFGALVFSSLNFTFALLDLGASPFLSLEEISTN
jgi:hypothetical protein